MGGLEPQGGAPHTALSPSVELPLMTQCSKPVPCSTTATSHVWLLITYNVTRETRTWDVI